MLRVTTIQERLWELRKDKGLNLEELAQQTGISKSALASYEANDNKEINHGNLITLADFYDRDFALKNKNPCSACEFQAKQGISIWGIKLLFFSV